MTPIYTPGPSRWHCLTVPPQGERRAKQWLDRRGVYSFYPVEERTRHRLGRQTTAERPYIPGYVFARFPGAPWWHLIMGDGHVYDVIRYTGAEEPAWLVEASLSSLMDMRSRAELLEEKRRRGMTIRKGDRVRIRDGVLAGNVVEIVELRATRGVFRMGLLGLAEQEIELDRLEKVA